MSKSQSTLNTTSLENLVPAEQRLLFDKIDRLRQHGLGEIIPLPQIVVCGDQSSGKSSVLEALTEVPFPRRDILCTRFATEIVIRHTNVKTETATVEIIPHSGRHDVERATLARFHRQINSLDQLPEVINSAAKEMGIDPSGQDFSKDVLRVEIQGPNQAHLTVVDLPGLIQRITGQQTEDDKLMVESLVEEYIRKPRTIILLVINARYDYSNQMILDRFWKADPERKRTLGIITHPDAIEGELLREKFIKLAKNEDPRNVLQLGWHFLRNRRADELGQSFAARNKIENEFFAKEPWRSLPNIPLKYGHSIGVGISSLKTRLSKLLYDHIRQELPEVNREIDEKLESTYRELRQLGKPRLTEPEQKKFLSELGRVFSEICKDAIDGNYQNYFFGEATVDTNWIPKRLRAVIQNKNFEFSRLMRLDGHQKEIVEPGMPRYRDHIEDYAGLEVCTRQGAIEWVQGIARNARSLELPGTLNYTNISELFWAQSSPWEKLARDHLRNQYDSVYRFLRLLMEYLDVPRDMAQKIFVCCIDPAMKVRKEKAQKELRNLLEDRKRHAMTYNPNYLIERLRPKSIEDLLSAIGIDDHENPLLDIEEITKKLTLQWAREHQERLARREHGYADVDLHSEELLDSMLAYYKQALETFIDNVNNQVIERRLVQRLGDVFNTSIVLFMDAQQVERIAGESPDQKERREELERRKEALEEGLELTRMELKVVKNFARASGKGGHYANGKANGRGSGYTVNGGDGGSITDDDSSSTKASGNDATNGVRTNGHENEEPATETIGKPGGTSRVGVQDGAPATFRNESAQGRTGGRRRRGFWT